MLHFDCLPRTDRKTLIPMNNLLMAIDAAVDLFRGEEEVEDGEICVLVQTAQDVVLIDRDLVVDCGG